MRAPVHNCCVRYPAPRCDRNTRADRGRSGAGWGRLPRHRQPHLARHGAGPGNPRNCRGYRSRPPRDFSRSIRDVLATTGLGYLRERLRSSTIDHTSASFSKSKRCVELQNGTHRCRKPPKMLEILGGLLGLAFAAGFVGSLSGLGGGVFIVLALVIAAHMPMVVAIGASLISVVATSAGASVAFVRDGWTNLRVAMVLECATVTGAIGGALLAGVIPAVMLEVLFALMMLQSAYFTLSKQDDVLIEHGDPLARRLQLVGDVPDAAGNPTHYETV